MSVPPTTKREANWQRVAGKSAVTEPQADTRNHPLYHGARGLTALPGGGRKRQIGAQP